MFRQQQLGDCMFLLQKTRWRGRNYLEDFTALVNCFVYCRNFCYSRFRPAALALAQRTLAAAEIASLAAALILLFRVRVAAGPSVDPWILAHLFRAPARMLARPRALNLLLGAGAWLSVGSAGAPRVSKSSVWRS